MSAGEIHDPQRIRVVLTRAQRARVVLQRGTNRRAQPERAWIEQVRDDSILLSTENFDGSPREQVFLNLPDEDGPFFLSCEMIRHAQGELEVAIPSVLYRAERRGRRRIAPAGSGAVVQVVTAGGVAISGRQIDESGDGLGVSLDRPINAHAGAHVLVGVPGAANTLHGEIRSVADYAAGGGWRRIGLVLTHAPRSSSVATERRGEIAPCERASSETAALDAHRSLGVQYWNADGERIEAVIDWSGTISDCIAVVIPPSWGKTKESTVGLAETILQTFATAGQSVCVLRFDGIRKRGESHNDNDCLPPIGENKHYTFSQGVRDIHASLDYLKNSVFRPAATFLITFSIAAVEGRRAIATDLSGRIDGWISVVGAVDPQSMIKVVSGGVDYFAGALDGLRFGTQYIQGLLLDVDRATADAIENGLAFLDDARRDMAKIVIPITWIYGTHDAWTSADRVRDILSVGETSRRRLIEIPTGHQMRASDEALDAFQLVAGELGKMALGRLIPTVRPDRSSLRERRRRERRPSRGPREDLRDFWRDYVVGRDGRLGIELVSATTSYRSFMALQIAALELDEDSLLVDLGSGAGALPVALLGERRADWGRILEVDFVAEGLRRSRHRVRQLGGKEEEFAFVAANLDRRGGVAGIPLVDGCASAVLASLLVNYLSDPRLLVREAARVLREGGRFVVSGMRPDADVSRICVSGVGELREGDARGAWGAEEIHDLDLPLQEFISSGARLLDLEEAGTFQFFDAGELVGLVEGELFRVLRVVRGYGDPPQAIVVVAERTGLPA